MSEDLYEIYRGRRDANDAAIHPHRWLTHRFDLKYAIYSQIPSSVGASGSSDSPQPSGPLLQIGDRQLFDICDLPSALRRCPRSNRRGVYLANPTIAAWYRAEQVDTGQAEGFIADSLAEEDPSLRFEVATPVGHVDCLSDARLIEIKRLARWKEGLGQLCAYGVYLPGRQRVLHLFGRANAPASLVRVREVCGSGRPD